jgi:glucose/arabinose dehydrogenase
MTRTQHHIRKPILALSALFLLLPPLDAAAQLRAEPVAQGFTRPLGIVPDPTNPAVLFVLEQGGMIKTLVNGQTQPTPFLDLTAEVKNRIEQGLLGLAFAPDGQRLFVFWVKKRTPDLGVGDTVISRFRRSTDPLVVDPASRFDLVWPGNQSIIAQPTDVHKGGTLAFGPDGFLYIGLGDGGGVSHPIVNAQNPSLLYGKMLRIDVNVPDNDLRGYIVPPDNPFMDGVPVPALGEIWSFGFRNPWRWSFDDFGEGATNALIIGDVGQDAREEINYEPAGRGGRNYGWYLREGRIPFIGAPPNGAPAFLPLAEPLADYPRSVGHSVTGGFVYRGTGLPTNYRGRYFVADYFGGVYSLGLSIDQNGEARVADVLDHTQELGDPFLVATFGRDLAGELYFSSFIGGTIYKIVTAPAEVPGSPQNLTSSVAGSTVAISWQPSSTGGATMGYRLEAGSVSGASDLLVTNLSTRELVLSGVPAGIYHVRVRAFNGLGMSEPSTERQVRVGCVGTLPGPSGLTGSAGPGGVASVSWSAVDGATSYVLEAGSAPGLSDVAVIPVAGLGLSGVVPPGTYHVRVRAVTECGPTAPSTEIVVTVP